MNEEDDSYQVFIVLIAMKMNETCRDKKTMKTRPKEPGIGVSSLHQMVSLSPLSRATVQVISECPTSFRGARRCSRNTVTTTPSPCSIHFVAVKMCQAGSFDPSQ